MKNNKSILRQFISPVEITDDIPDVSKDPVIIQKNKLAVAFLKEHGVPKEMADRQDKKRKNGQR